jgi:3-phosphoshikimate 1-carboxyvinyltransferase
MTVKILPGGIAGEVAAIPSKSHLHRLLIFATLADSETLIFCRETTAEDIIATVDCLCALGAEIEKNENGYAVTPINREKLAKKNETIILPCGESGSTLRFMLPVVCALGVRGAFEMKGRLPERPLAPLDEQLKSHGIRLWREKPDVLFCEGQLAAGEYELPGDVSSQYVTGLLMALPLLRGKSRLTITSPLESAAYVDITLDVAKNFGQTYENFEINGVSSFKNPEKINADGDWSNGAFWLCAGAMPRGDIRMSGLEKNSTQGDREIFNVLKKMGADISWSGGVIHAKEKNRAAAEIDAREIPDLIPVLAAVASVSEGTTVFKNAARLRIKESDRLMSTAKTLTALGADIRETEDGLIVEGKKNLRGGTVDAHGDHRIAMMAAIASAACEEPVTVTNAQAVNKSYPNFWRDLEMLGKKILLLLFFVFFSATAVFANEINVTIDGEPVIFSDQRPVIVNGRTLVPLRGVFEMLGFDVAWEQETQTASFQQEERRVTILIGRNYLFTDVGVFAVEVPAQIINGRTMLPLRAALETIGYNVGWNSAASTVVVTTDSASTLSAGNQLFDVQLSTAAGFSRVQIQEKFEQETLRLTNTERQNNGLQPLIWHDSLGRAARVHSEDLARNNLSGHVGSDGSSVTARVMREGWNAGAGISASIAYSRTPQDVVTTLINSSANREVVLHKDFTHIGVGFSWCENSNRMVTSYKFGISITEDCNTVDPAFNIFVLLDAGYSYAQIQDRLEQEVFRLTNIERENHGLRPLIWNDSLATAARVHSEDSAANDFTGHTGSDGSTPSDRARRADWTAGAGENVAYNITPQSAVTALMNSPGHRENILQNYTHMGIGVAWCGTIERLVTTQKFGIARH